MKEKLKLLATAGVFAIAGCGSPYRPPPTPESSLLPKATASEKPRRTPIPGVLADCEIGPFRGERNETVNIGEKVVFEALIDSDEGVAELELTPKDQSGFGFNLKRNSTERFSAEITGLHSFNVLTRKLHFLIDGNQVGNKVELTVVAECLDRPQIS